VGAEEGVVCGGKTNLIADGFRLEAAVRGDAMNWCGRPIAVLRIVVSCFQFGKS